MKLLKRRKAKPQPQPVAAPPDEDAILAKLAQALAKQVGLTPEEIDVTVAFTRYGLDSVQAAQLSGDMEEWLGRSLLPSLMYDYPTAESLARYLAGDPAAPLPPLPVGLTAEDTV
jgi:acyl carrier protein